MVALELVRHCIADSRSQVNLDTRLIRLVPEQTKADETVAMKISSHKTRSASDHYNITSSEDVIDPMRAVETASLRKPAVSLTQSDAKFTSGPVI